MPLSFTFPTINYAVFLPILGLVGLSINQLVNHDYSGLSNSVLSILALLGVHLTASVKQNILLGNQKTLLASIQK